MTWINLQFLNLSKFAAWDVVYFLYLNFYISYSQLLTVGPRK